MTKGIRTFTISTFGGSLPKFQSGEMTGKAFRTSVIQEVATAFQISIASASTHYNHALKLQRAADPNSVLNLGRPEGKKGGRKPKHLVDVIKVKTGEIVAAGVSKSVAEQLITKAAAAKKSKLAIRSNEPVAELDLSALADTTEALNTMAEEALA